jgi:hypothetical protein
VNRAGTCRTSWTCWRCGGAALRRDRIAQRGAQIAQAGRRRWCPWLASSCAPRECVRLAGVRRAVGGVGAVGGGAQRHAPLSA